MPRKPIARGLVVAGSLNGTVERGPGDSDGTGDAVLQG